MESKEVLTSFLDRRNNILKSVSVGMLMGMIHYRGEKLMQGKRINCWSNVHKKPLNKGGGDKK